MNIIISNVNCVTDNILWAPKDPFSEKNPNDIPEPYWYRQRHAHVYFYFYIIEKNIDKTYMLDSYIYGNSFENIISFILKKFNVNLIYHTLPDFYVNFSEFYNFSLKKNYTGLKEIKILNIYDNFIIDVNSDKKYTICLGYDTSKIYPKESEKRQIFQDSDKKMKLLSLKEYTGFSYFKNIPWRPNKSTNVTVSHKCLSLGGWCGPAEALRTLGLRTEAYPFDYMHASLHSINYIVRGHYKFFFNPNFNIFPHHKLHNPKVKDDLYRRLNRFTDTLKNEKKPILFIRAIINIDYNMEIRLVQEFIDLIKRKYPLRKNDKVLMILHSQKIGTLKIKMIQDDIMLSCAEGLVGWNVPNRVNLERNYRKLIDFALDDKSWNNEILVKEHIVTPHTVKDWEKVKNM